MSNVAIEPVILEVAREIVESHSYASIDVRTGARVEEGTPKSCIFDVQSANALISVYDNISPQNQLRFADRMHNDPIEAIQFAFKVLNKRK